MDHEESTDDKEIFDDGEKLDCKETMDNKDIKHGKENTVDNDQDDGCQQDSETDNSPPLVSADDGIHYRYLSPQMVAKIALDAIGHVKEYPVFRSSRAPSVSNSM